MYASQISGKPLTIFTRPTLTNCLYECSRHPAEYNPVLSRVSPASRPVGQICRSEQNPFLPIELFKCHLVLTTYPPAARRCSPTLNVNNSALVYRIQHFIRQNHSPFSGFTAQYGRIRGNAARVSEVGQLTSPKSTADWLRKRKTTHQKQDPD